MATYLLLRDNKQFGPLTLDELKQKGFKAYDLVWVEGKSAAWRYPSEIEELKAFAPVVEEQPFDRFYKRPVAENKNSTVVQKEIPQVREEPKPAIAEKQYVNISRGESEKVYVTLPARTAASLSTPAPSIKKNIAEEIKYQPAPEKIYNEEKFVKESAFGNEFLQTDVVQKNQSVEKRQQAKSVAGNKMLKPLLITFAVVALLGSGILIGMLLNKNASVSVAKNNEEVKQAPVTSNNQPAKENQSNTSAIPVSNKPTDTNQNNQPANQQADISNQQEKITPEKNTNITSQTSTQVDNKDVAADPNKKIQQKPKLILPKKIPVPAQGEATTTDSDASGVVHRSATHRTDEVSEKAALKTNIADMVGLTASNYTVGTFGGISNLQITVSNHSIYPLDLVVVEVQYIQANKKIFKTENIYFHNVGAGSALMQEAPKSPRGIKVEYKLVLINSKESGLSYSN
jgi:hypothetical protein